MNIAISTVMEFNPQLGGTERVSSNLAVAFEQLGHTVYFVAMREFPNTQRYPYKPVVEQMMLPNSLIADSEENINCFTSFLVEKKIDILINQAGILADFSNLCIAVKARTNVKLLSVLHFDPARIIKQYKAEPSLLLYRSAIVRYLYVFLKKIFFFRLKLHMKACSNLYKRLYIESDAVILLSDYYKTVFKSLARLDVTTKLRSIPNALSFSIFEEICPKEKQIIWVGRMCVWAKRPDRLVQIWSYLEDKHPDWQVLFLGDGPYKPKLEQFVKQLGLKNIRFGGFTDPQEAYRQSSIICMTSTHEGFGMVLIEAMQFGVVPMAFNSFESLDDIIEEGITGYKIKPFDLKQYACRLEMLMTDENKRMQIALNARKLVTEKFGTQQIIKKWITLFEQVSFKK